VPRLWLVAARPRLDHLHVLNGDETILHHQVEIREHAVDPLRVVDGLDGDGEIRDDIRARVFVHLPRVPEPDEPLGGGGPREPVLVSEIDDLSPERLVVPPLVLAHVDDEPLHGTLVHHILRATQAPSNTAANPSTSAAITYAIVPSICPSSASRRLSTA